MQQFDTFEGEPRDFYMNIESVVREIMKEKYTGFSKNSAKVISKEIQGTIDYLAQTDKKLSEVSGSHRFYYVMGERLSQCVECNWKQRLEKIKKQCDKGNASEAIWATGLIVSVQTICQTINFVTQDFY